MPKLQSPEDMRREVESRGWTVSEPPRQDGEDFSLLFASKDGREIEPLKWTDEKTRRAAFVFLSLRTLEIDRDTEGVRRSTRLVNH